MLALGQPTAALLMLVVLKLGVDVVAHMKGYGSPEDAPEPPEIGGPPNGAGPGRWVLITSSWLGPPRGDAGLASRSEEHAQ